MRAEVSRLAYPFLQAEAGAFLPSVAPSPLVLLVELGSADLPGRRRAKPPPAQPPGLYSYPEHRADLALP